MSELKLTKKEQAWIERFQKTMAAAPRSLSHKVWSFTTGDDNITLYDREKFLKYCEDNPDVERRKVDHCTIVEEADAEILWVQFPFPVESTTG